jgi:hypothetical protein
MPLLRHREQHATPAPHLVEVPRHPKALAHRRAELLVQLFCGRHSLAVVMKHRAHERGLAVRVIVVLRLGDETVMRGEEPRDTRDDARGVRTVSRQDVDRLRPLPQGGKGGDGLDMARGHQ